MVASRAFAHNLTVDISATQKQVSGVARSKLIMRPEGRKDCDAKVGLEGKGRGFAIRTVLGQRQCCQLRKKNACELWTYAICPFALFPLPDATSRE